MRNDRRKIDRNTKDQTGEIDQLKNSIQKIQEDSKKREKTHSGQIDMLRSKVTEYKQKNS